MIQLYKINLDSVVWCFLQYTHPRTNGPCMLPRLLNLVVTQILKRGVDLFQFSRRISQHVYT